ncbi:HlyD family secretion protein [Candidatus Latescibacterota bacterium]
MRRYIIIGSILLAAILIIMVYPGDIPYNIKTVGKILPIKEWVVTRDMSGVMSAILRDNNLGQVNSYYVADFERGDPVRFFLNDSIYIGMEISVGDTIGWIESKELELEIVRVSGELKVQKSLLDVAASGEKESLVLEEVKRVEHAREEYAGQEKIVARLKELYEADFGPYQDYEIALNTLNLLKKNIDIAEAELITVQTGLKPEEINLISLGISNLGDELDTLQDIYKDYTITSPISGLVFESTLGDTLVKIGDISSYSVIIPLEINSMDNVYPGQKIEYMIDRVDETFEGEIVRMGNVIHVMNGQQVILVTANLDYSEKVLLNGLMVRLSIICEPMTLREHILRSFFAFLK